MPFTNTRCKCSTPKPHTAGNGSRRRRGGVPADCVQAPGAYPGLEDGGTAAPAGARAAGGLAGQATGRKVPSSATRSQT